MTGLGCENGSRFDEKTKDTTIVINRMSRPLSTSVANKKSHLQPSVEVGMKNVDKNIDNRNKQ
jgi:hypothetical protein